MMWKILKWLRRLLRKPGVGHIRNVSWPTNEQIALLPWFEGVCPEDIVVISTKEGARRAYEELLPADVVGFDTESKPTFVKGEKSNGPHVAQFSTPERTYIFMLHEEECRKEAGALIASAAIRKVGFGLQDDLRRIREKLNVHPREVLDLETLFSARGYGKGVGVKVAVALIFKERFRKSKKASTSNWASHHLSDQQLLYAANDSYAAIKVYHELTKPK